MAVSNKFVASMLSVPNELNLAAASINFDFSLMKVDAPKEYHGVRDALSTARRSEAEDGQSHITARRLGALFEGLVPSIPHLIAAYGSRVSEISSRVASKAGTDKQRLGIFSSNAGPDCTNIWAAATSGKGALAVHLLACMLARIWKSHEATSIWVEIVERRRHEINDNTKPETNLELGTVLAAKQTFGRSQLAAWDASARSWLQTADSDLRRQHTQLMLIISNVSLPVNPRNDAYEGVIEAWTSAMRTMERMVQGIPHQVRDGSVLLSMSAWHLHPDMEVLGDEIISVQQNDALMNHSLLTIPAHQAHPTREGVFWSLPLSRMRYYSPPVVTERRLASDTSRISMEEFQVVVLGACIANWDNALTDIERCCRLIISLAKLASGPIEWLEYLVEAANTILSSHGSEKTYLLKLFKMGRRHCRSLLADARSLSDLPPFFGLTSFTSLLGMLEGTEAKIDFLRSIMSDDELEHDDLVIRVTHSIIKPESSTDPATSLSQYASVIPRPRTSVKRTSDNVQYQTSGHCRWIPLSAHYTAHIRALSGCAHAQKHTQDDYVEHPVCGCNFECQCMSVPCICEMHLGCPCQAPGGIQCSILCHPEGASCVKVGLGKCARKCSGDGCCSACFFQHNQQIALNRSEECSFLLNEYAENLNNFWHFALQKDQLSKKMIYQFVLGDPKSAAVFQREGKRSRHYVTKWQGSAATLENIELALMSQNLDKKALYKHLNHWWRDGTSTAMGGDVGQSLEALIFARSLYANIIEPTIDIGAVSLPIHKMKWRPSSAGTYLSRGFACIAMFESGEFNIDPSQLQGVMALSVGDSIYVASRLLSDPTADVSRCPIQRVFGNLGRPEMVLLIPPSLPRLQPRDPHSWKLVNHHLFDGKFEDSFALTSLHLSFTDFELSVDVGQRGLRDSRVVLLEALVSINHRGKHVGDLDILAIFSSTSLIQIERSCNKHGGNSDSTRKKKVSITKLISIDNWEEFLDFPDSVSIFRSTGNWQGRIAGAAAGIQSGKRVVILPSDPCLTCVSKWEQSKDVDLLIS